MIAVNIKTSRNDSDLVKRMNWFLSQPGINWNILSSISSYSQEPLLNITRKGVILQTGKEKLSFHPSMALLRIINLIRGKQDRFLMATGLGPGDRICDATLGLATDALIAAVAVGEHGMVTGIENSPILAALVEDGLKYMAEGFPPSLDNPDKTEAWAKLMNASARVEVNWSDHLSFLKNLPDKSYDVVYFDPMFRRTREDSASIRPLHSLSNPSALTLEAVEHACRVAKKRVVLKERKGSNEFTRLGFYIAPEGKYSEVDYGIRVI
ncbi:MAG: class I SAM-dependent methyltransferase [Desulfitobacterium hafniense]|nr:class I SAM-dependent methyltransferase [Desulfitobacterium hafniense]